jgi:menaquinol-cytochrome c reductase iron-sulfur subunit
MDSSETPASTDSDSVSDDRRDFLLKAGSICAGCALAGVPIAAGLRVVAHPVTKAQAIAGVGGAAPFISVASLDALPEDGSPQKFTVRADKADAWSRFPDQVIGAVFLRRIAEGSDESAIQAFNVVCPHLGCAIEFRDENRDYFCPCHNSAFALEDGAQEVGSPSARGMDELAVRVESNGDIAVQFQNFVMGIPDKKPV